MHFYLQFFQHLGEIQAVTAQPGEHDRAHGVQKNLVRMAGRQILHLAAIFSIGQHLFALIAKSFEGLANARGLSRRNASNLIKV